MGAVMSAHTPGPWRKANDGILADNAAWVIYDPHIMPANARLIAAAPDLLAELKWVAGRIDRCSGSPNFTADEHDRICAAIAKAEGTL